MISTTPKGHAPIRKPYTLDSKQPKANANVKPRCRRSSEYAAIMKVNATTPNTVGGPQDGLRCDFSWIPLRIELKHLMPLRLRSLFFGLDRAVYRTQGIRVCSTP